MYDFLISRGLIVPNADNNVNLNVQENQHNPNGDNNVNLNVHENQHNPNIDNNGNLNVQENQHNDGPNIDNNVNLNVQENQLNDPNHQQDMDNNVNPIQLRRSIRQKTPVYRLTL